MSDFQKPARFRKPITFLMLASLLLGLTSQLALAQFEDKTFYPRDADAWIAAIEYANEHPDEVIKINLRGKYEFTEPYDLGDSFLPPLAPGVTVYHTSYDREDDELDRVEITTNTQGGSESSTLFLGSPDDTFTLILDFLVYAAPRSKPKTEATIRPQNHVTDDQMPSFQGFDYLVDGSNGVVILSGLFADCGEQCVNLEGGRALLNDVVMHCVDDCLRVSDPGSDIPEVKWDALMAGIDDLDLPNSEKALQKGKLARYQGLLEKSDVVVSDSDLRSVNVAVAVTGTGQHSLFFENSFLQSTSTGSSAVKLQSSGVDNLILNSVVSAPVSRTDALTFTYGALSIENTFIEAGEQGMNVTDGKVTLRQVSVAMDMENIQQVCDTTFGSDEFISEGGNIVPDESCGLDGPLDMEMTVPGLYMADDGDVVPTLPVGSPEVELGAFAVSDSRLPCTTTDMTGLPRPQDASKDDQARCDSGPVEKQVGGDIAAPQSGAYYSPERVGEGIFVEMLSETQAVVYLFSYRPDGSPFWSVGVGTITRNGIVMLKSEFSTTQGPTFGENYDHADLEYIPFADFSVSLPGCAGESDAGMLAINPNEELGFAPLLGRMIPLSAIMDCDQELFGKGFSGSFFDPSHNGEGIIVQVTSETSAVIIWFTYDAQGNQYWVLGVGTIDGNTINVDEAFSQFGPEYGPGFDPDDANNVDWGNFSAIFSDDCESADFSYESKVEGFGSGTQDMVRLTNLEGVNCGP